MLTRQTKTILTSCAVGALIYICGSLTVERLEERAYSVMERRNELDGAIVLEKKDGIATVQDLDGSVHEFPVWVFEDKNARQYTDER